MSNPIKLYNFPKSGHAHRIELMLSLLALPTELVFVDLAAGAHKQPEFLALNPFGQVPVIDDNGTVIADSNAILVYLAKKYDNGAWLPEDPVAAAAVQRWLSVGNRIRRGIQYRRGHCSRPCAAQGDRYRVGRKTVPGRPYPNHRRHRQLLVHRPRT